MHELLQRLQAVFPDQVRISETLGQTVVAVEAPQIAPVAAFLKDEGFRLLLDVTVVDYLHRKPRFDVVYELYHLEERDWLRLHVGADGEDPEVPSIAGVFASANWAERECFDLFGIRFKGHPDLRRILMPEDWQGHPLRKDYPLTGPAELPPLAHE